MQSLFETDPERGAEADLRSGLRVIPSWLTAGPWSPDAQHGGPPAALLAWAIRGHDNPILDGVNGQVPADATRPFALVRITVDLLRPVPLTPLTIRARTIRPGKRVQLVEASLWADGEPDAGVEVARAVGMRVRNQGSAAGDQPFEYPPEGITATDALVAATRPTLGPEAGVRADLSGRGEGFHSRATELRFIRGNVSQPGPGTMWGRIVHPFIDGEWLRGAPLAVALADFGNAVGSTLQMHEWAYMNTDLTVNLHREPMGEWICLDSIMQITPSGWGQATSALFDLDGSIGRSAASLLIVRQ